MRRGAWGSHQEIIEAIAIEIARRAYAVPR